MDGIHQFVYGEGLLKDREALELTHIRHRSMTLPGNKEHWRGDTGARKTFRQFKAAHRLNHNDNDKRSIAESTAIVRRVSRMSSLISAGGEVAHSDVLLGCSSPSLLKLFKGFYRCTECVQRTLGGSV